MREVNRIINFTREMLLMARAGLDDIFSNNPSRYRAGLINLVTHGRNVTFNMENLRGKNPDFDGWYKAHTDKIGSDPFMRYMNKLRVGVTHRAQLPTSTSFNIGMDGPVNSDDMIGAAQRDAPPNTVSTFVGGLPRS